MNTFLRKIYTSASRILRIRFLYELLIKPRSLDETNHRKEFVLNILLTGILGILLVLGASLVWSLVRNPIYYAGISPWIFLGITLFFAGLLCASRLGYRILSSIGLVGLLFGVTLYAVALWTFILPMIILSAVLTIIVSGILFSNKTGFIITFLITVAIIALTWLQSTGVINASLDWQNDPISVQAAMEMCIIFFSVSGISWLANRETEHSLKRAHASEQALILERNLLEVKIEERTKELKMLQEQQLTELQHLAAFGKLSSGIFHDLMTPLTSIIAMVDTTTSSASPADVRRYVEKAITASKKMGEQLQLIKKTISPQTEELFIPRKEISDAIDLLAYKIRRAGVTCVADDLCTEPITGNAILFHRIAANIISNAVDAYATIPTPSTDRRVLISCVKNSQELIFTVTDFGTGISAEHHSKIFEPFFTTKETSGIGIGLSTVKHIIEKDFKGTISFVTSPKGTTFTVVLPLFHT